MHYCCGFSSFHFLKELAAEDLTRLVQIGGRSIFILLSMFFRFMVLGYMVLSLDYVFVFFLLFHSFRLVSLSGRICFSLILCFFEVRSYVGGCALFAFLFNAIMVFFTVFFWINVLGVAKVLCYFDVCKIFYLVFLCLVEVQPLLDGAVSKCLSFAI